MSVFLVSHDCALLLPPWEGWKEEGGNSLQIDTHIHPVWVRESEQFFQLAFCLIASYDWFIGYKPASWSWAKVSMTKSILSFRDHKHPLVVKLSHSEPKCWMDGGPAQLTKISVPVQVQFLYSCAQQLKWRSHWQWKSWFSGSLQQCSYDMYYKKEASIKNTIHITLETCLFNITQE